MESASKKFKLIKAWEASTSQHPSDVNWELCVLCQEQIAEALICPLHSKRNDIGKATNYWQSLRIIIALIEYKETNTRKVTTCGNTRDTYYTHKTGN